MLSQKKNIGFQSVSSDGDDIKQIIPLVRTFFLIDTECDLINY